MVMKDDSVTDIDLQCGVCEAEIVSCSYTICNGKEIQQIDTCIGPSAYVLYLTRKGKILCEVVSISGLL